MQTTNRRFLVQDDPEQEEERMSKNTVLLIHKLSLLCLTTFYFGYSLVYLSALKDQTLLLIYGTDVLNPLARGLLIGCLTIGAMIGAVLSMFVIPLATRRNLILILCIIALLIEGGIQVQSIITLYIFRTLQGILVGLFMAIVPKYISQLAPKQLLKKGLFGVFANLFVVMGVMFAFGFGVILIISDLQDHIRWRILIGVNFFAVLITATSILLKIIPQSPISLIQMGKQQQAKAVIALFHRKKFVEEVYKTKVAEIQKAKNAGTQKPQPFNVKTFLAYEIPMMQQLTGINAVISQLGTVVKVYNVSFGQFVPALMALSQFIAAIYAMSCLAKVQRRKMILFGNLGMGIFSMGIGILLLFLDEFQAGFWIMILFATIYMSIHGGTLIPTVWLYVGEVTAGKPPPYSSVTNWLMCSVAIVIFSVVNLTFGHAPIFLTFGTISILLFILNYFIMIETKTKKVQEIKLQLSAN